MTDAKYICEHCGRKFKTEKGLSKHVTKCKKIENIVVPQENNYDVNMTFLEDNKVEFQLKNTDDEGEHVLKEILKPKISQTYQEEIDKLQELIDMFTNMPVPENDDEKDSTIAQLKTTITILMSQSQNLIKEMQNMSRKNSYLKNNIMLAAFILDKCKKDVPENDEDFDKLFV